MWSWKEKASRTRIEDNKSRVQVLPLITKYESRQTYLILCIIHDMLIIELTFSALIFLFYLITYIYICENIVICTHSFIFTIIRKVSNSFKELEIRNLFISNLKSLQFHYKLVFIDLKYNVGLLFIVKIQYLQDGSEGTILHLIWSHGK